MRKQKGFALLELMLAIAVSALLAMYMSSRAAKDTEDSLAEGAANYMMIAGAGAANYTLLNWDALANGTDVPGVATDLRPTLAELQAKGNITTAFPIAANSVPTRQSLRVDITRTNCPGANCKLDTLVCTTTAVTLGRADTRYDLAAIMVQEMKGTGGMSLQNAGTVIRGPSINMANPVGNVPGVVCAGATVDTALYQNFVKIGDSRNPDLKGNLTVAGNTTVNGNSSVGGTLTVTGATTINNSTTINGAGNINGDLSVGTCAKILQATGRAGFGCKSPTDLPAGYTGGVRSPDVVADRNIVVSSSPAGFTGANGKYAIMTVTGTEAEVRTSGRAAADRLTPTGQYAAGAACVAADNGSIARQSGATGLVMCDGTAWRKLTTFATAGGACTTDGEMADSTSSVKLLCVNNKWQGMNTIIRPGTPNASCTMPGVTAIDTANNNETLICRANPAGGGNRYFRLRDLTTNMVFVSANEVNDSTVITKPTCSAASGMTALPIIQLIPKVYASPDGGVAIYAVDNGSTWTSYLRNGSGTPLSGAPKATAVAQIFCYFL